MRRTPRSPPRWRFEAVNVGIVIAVAENGVIGRDGGLPWRLSADLKRFKALTLGSPVIMGRKTWESVGRPLPGRRNMVITRNAAYQAEGAEVFGSLDDALQAASQDGADDIYVIGGGQLCAEAMQRADRLHITHIDARIEGDTFLPPIDPAIWHAVQEEVIPVGEKDDHPTRYVVYERRAFVP